MNELVACFCGGVHMQERTSLGPMIACPEVPPGMVYYVNPTYMRYTPPRPLRIPRPEATW